MITEARSDFRPLCDRHLRPMVPVTLENIRQGMTCHVDGCKVPRPTRVGSRVALQDFYDLYMLAKHFKDGPTALAEQLAPHAKNPLLQEAIANIKRYFRMPEDFGPTLSC
jgi:hypothetical protein